MVSLLAEHARDRRRLDAVLEIVRAVGSTLELDTLLQVVMEQVTEALEADRSTLYVVDHGAGELWSKVVQGDELRTIRLPIGNGIAGWVAQHSAPVRLDDAHGDPRFDATWDRSSGYRTHSLVCVPFLNKEGRVVGVIQTLNKSQGLFTEADQAMLQALGGPVAIAIENAVLYQRLVERNRSLAIAQRELTQANRELSILNDLHRAARSARTEDDLADTLLSLVRERVDAKLVALERVTADGLRCWTWTTSDGQLHRSREQPPEPFSQWLASGLAAPVLANDVPIAGLHLVANQLGDDDSGMPRMVALLATEFGRAMELHRARAAEEQAARMALVGRAVSAVLHDLRTPLSAIDGYTELLAESDTEEEKEAIKERIRRAMEHMQTMTREVLGFARGERELLLANVHLNEFIDHARELLSPGIESAGIGFNVRDDFRGPARFDRDKIMRVVTNLVRNACQAVGEGGQVTWHITAEHGTLQMDFIDDGPGVPADVRDRLFTFFATSGKAGGTGLGLAMSRRIVEAHNGSIECAATSPEGTTFRVRLPLE